MKVLLIILILLGALHGTSQVPDSFPQKDSLNLLQSLTKGKISGRARYFFMATDNSSHLSDYHAHAAGLLLRYESRSFKGFHATISGSFAQKLESSNLAVPDPETGQKNRYEIGLFDITDPAHKTMARWDEAYLHYQFKKGFARAGRQYLNTPFINLQDGRLNVTATEGIWINYQLKKSRIEAGYIRRISPRSTNRWYSIGESVGIYPQGVNPDGSRAAYAHHLHSDGIFLAGWSTQPFEGIRLSLWNQLVTNIFNSTMVQVDARKQKQAHTIGASLQFTWQEKINNGGHADPAFTYFHPSRAQVLSSQAWWQHKQWEISSAYTHVFASTYLMPREWGRDPFFTFMPRERNEGFAGVNAYVLKSSFTAKGMKFAVAAGHFDLPAANDHPQNKYGMPSYNQLNAEIRYTPSRWINGLELSALYVYKDQTGNDFGNPSFVINKTDMSLYNLLIQYRF